MPPGGGAAGRAGVKNAARGGPTKGGGAGLRLLDSGGGPGVVSRKKIDHRASLDSTCSGDDTSNVRNSLKEKLEAFVDEHSTKFAETLMKIVDGEVGSILNEITDYRQAAMNIDKKDAPSNLGVPEHQQGKIPSSPSMLSIRSPSRFTEKQSGQEEPEEQKKKQAVFPDAAAMKEKVRAAVAQKSYNVADFYYENSCCSRIARSQLFENLTHVIIALNAFWIAVETDHNKAVLIWEAKMVFLIVENAFCAYFTWEWLIRFFAFQKKTNALRDRWMVFDSILVMMMVLETWVLSVIFTFASGGSSSGFGNTSVLKLMRLVRLTRMARMIRLLRAFPELVILLKGIMVAARSVGFTLLLLSVIIYFYAVIFRQLTERAAADDPDVLIKSMYFGTVDQAMGSLLLDAILPDVSQIVRDCYDQDWVFSFVMLTFILMASMTVMNMLIGVLCEVVSVVSAVENEALTVNYVKFKLLSMFSLFQADPEMISKEEFEDLLLHPSCARCFQEIGLDVVGLVDFSDYIFRDGHALSFCDLMEVVLQLRGTNNSTVKDLVDLRRYMAKELASIRTATSKISKQMAKVLEHEGTSKLAGIGSALCFPTSNVLVQGTIEPQDLNILMSATVESWGKGNAVKGKVESLDPKDNVTGKVEFFDPKDDVKGDDVKGKAEFFNPKDDVKGQIKSWDPSTEVKGEVECLDPKVEVKGEVEVKGANESTEPKVEVTGKRESAEPKANVKGGANTKMKSPSSAGSTNSIPNSLTWDPLRSTKHKPLELSANFVNCVARNVASKSGGESDSAVDSQVGGQPVVPKLVRAKPVTQLHRRSRSKSRQTGSSTSSGPFSEVHEDDELV
eukprot:TRINITY_DN3174_c0_g2_i4.p1 TRINITY_DN3174_c0_g2~~TRINITY_DN3174_c0_g2_i4.p1  ORF type:complete len:860 (+),score=175.81 TRINITY_DN3174_c0_g2_i4:47-2581(+)